MVPSEFLSPRDTSWLCLVFPKLLAKAPALAGVGRTCFATSTCSCFTEGRAKLL